MLPNSNQLRQLHGTAKTHKFNSVEDITLENLKFYPTVSQSGTSTYNAAQVNAGYLKPLYSDNDYIISFPKTVTTTTSIIAQWKICVVWREIPIH